MPRLQHLPADVATDPALQILKRDGARVLDAVAGAETWRR